MLSRLRNALPLTPWKASFSAVRVLLKAYAHARTSRLQRPVDRYGNPVPWYTYPALEYLRQLDFRDSDVFEFGSGYSTLFWATRARRVVSVDDDREWASVLSGQLPENCELIIETDLYEYPNTIQRSGRSFDVVVVDGAARGKTRLECSRRAIQCLRPGGMVILDNSDWLPESASFLRESGLIQVDMAGLGPINGYAWCTSFFLHRAFDFRPRGAHQPADITGGWDQCWERPASSELPMVRFGNDAFGGVRRDERFTIESPHGPRDFRLLVSTHTSGVRCVALLDMQRERVLIAINESSAGGDQVERQFDALTHLQWEEFRTWVNGHDQRRYDLPPLGDA
jgi:hypothetical protein